MFNRNLFLGIITFLLVFLLVNPYLPFHLKDFFTRSQELSIVFHYGLINFKSSLFFLQQIFTKHIPLIFLPLIFFGIIFLLKEKSNFSKLILVYTPIHLVINMLFLRHEGVFTIILPLISVYFALGIIWMSDFRNWIGKLSVVYSTLAIVFLITNAVFQSSLFLREGYITKAGEWINRNIPVNTTIAVPDGYFFDTVLPPFSFLNYKLVHFPTNLAKMHPEKNKLPRYIISVEDSLDISSTPEIEKYYRVIKSWERKEKFFDISFKKNPFIYTENSNINIYQLINR